jgi:hypothetical protein
MGQINTGMEQHQQQQGEPKDKQQNIEWRRNMVLEFISQGRTEREIAQILKVGNGTVHRDIAFLNKQAHDNLTYHINRKVPEQYQRCCNGLEQVLKMAWNIVITESNNQSNKLQALSLISEVYRHQMDLATNGVVVTDAIKYVNGKMDHLNNQEKKLLQDIKDKGDTEAEAEEDITTNGVF